LISWGVLRAGPSGSLGHGRDASVACQLGELAVRNTQRESPWRLTVSAFRSSDQRCALLIDSGVSEGCVPTDYANGHEQLEFGDFETRLFSLDAERLALLQGVELKAGADLAFLVVRTPAPSWDEGWYLRPEVWLKARDGAILCPHTHTHTHTHTHNCGLKSQDGRWTE